MLKIFNARSMAEEKVNERQVTIVEMFTGSAKENMGSRAAKPAGKIEMIPTNARYNGSAAEKKVLADIEYLQEIVKEKGEKHNLSKEDKAKFNAAEYPGQTAIEALVGAVYMDITRRAEEGGDLTSLFATEMNDPNSDELVRVNWFSKYIGTMGEITGTNDRVNLIEQNTGSTDSFSQTIKGVGWKTSLKNLLFNRIFDMAKVNQAAADADVDARNAAIIGAILGYTFTGGQAQAAASTGDTYEVNMYETLRLAIKKLRALKDAQTEREIVVPQISLLCNSQDTWDISRVINGQLAAAAGLNDAKNLSSLPIDNIVEYDRGITDGYTYGKDTLDFPGVSQGTCYLFVPREYLYVMNKRGLTLETGSGSVLEASQEEKMWYRVNGIYTADFLGDGSGDYGAIVEITLPTA